MLAPITRAEISHSNPARRVAIARSNPGVVKTPAPRWASRSAPDALLRVNQEGICLHVEPFDQFDPMPAASTLLGASLSSVLPRELANVVVDDLRAGELRRRAHEVRTGGYLVRVEISPTRDGTSWVRFRTIGLIDNNDPPVADPVRSLMPQARSRDATGSARIRLDPAGRIVDWNGVAARVTGLTADAVVGRRLASLSVDDGPWAAEVERLFRAPSDGPVECREWMWLSDGTRRWLALGLTPASDGYWVSLRDLTMRRVRDNRAAALYAVGRAALDARDVDDLARRILTAMCDALDWEVGVFWKVDRVENALDCRRVVWVGDQDPRDLKWSDVRLEKGLGLAGAVWAADRPETTFTGFVDHPVFSAPSLEGQLRTAFAFPVRGRDGMLGVFELASRAVEHAGPELQRTAAIVGNHVSQLSDRFRAEQALRESDAHKAAILSNALDGIIQVAIDGRVVEVNPEAGRTFDFEPLAMLGRDLTEFIAEEDDRVKLRDAVGPFRACREAVACASWGGEADSDFLRHDRRPASRSGESPCRGVFPQPCELPTLPIGSLGDLHHPWPR